MDANEQRSCKKPFNHELGAQGGGGGGGIWEKIDGGFGRDITAMSGHFALTYPQREYCTSDPDAEQK